MALVLPMLITGLIFLAFGGLRSGRKTPDIAKTRVAVVNLDLPVTGKLGFGQMLVDFLHDPRLAGLLEVASYEDRPPRARRWTASRPASSSSFPLTFRTRLSCRKVNLRCG